MQSREPPEPRRRSSSRVSENLELTNSEGNQKAKREKEKEILIQGTQIFFQSGEDVIRCE